MRSAVVAAAVLWMVVTTMMSVMSAVWMIRLVLVAIVVVAALRVFAVVGNRVAEDACGGGSGDGQSGIDRLCLAPV